MSVMPHERELRQEKDINYKIVDAAVAAWRNLLPKIYIMCLFMKLIMND